MTWEGPGKLIAIQPGAADGLYGLDDTGRLFWGRFVVSGYPYPDTFRWIELESPRSQAYARGMPVANRTAKPGDPHDTGTAKPGTTTT